MPSAAFCAGESCIVVAEANEALTTAGIYNFKNMGYREKYALYAYAKAQGEIGNCSFLASRYYTL